jgi:DNA modification methylase
MRKPGDNDEPVTKISDTFPVTLWQNYASPVWITAGEPVGDGFISCKPDINPSDTLQYRSARDDEDERHICPLQLEVIRRAIKLWTNPNDIVLTPFGGIGSEGYVAIQEGRRAILAELKDSYFKQLVSNCKAASKPAQADLFAP